jgi:uncharacterized phage protein (TIGR01671 family)
MREYEFRGKSVHTVGVDKGTWIYGNLMDIWGRPFIGKWCSEMAGGEARIKDILFCSYGEVDPETVGQYTGLKDKNGKKIFEGDIVREKSRSLFIVEWGKEATSNMLHNIQTGNEMYFLYREGYIEVIGNRWDNPALLIWQ